MSLTRKQTANQRHANSVEFRSTRIIALLFVPILVLVALAGIPSQIARAQTLDSAAEANQNMISLGNSAALLSRSNAAVSPFNTAFANLLAGLPESVHPGVQPIGSPAMTVAKSSTTSVLAAHGDVTYSYRVTNSGDVPLTNITLTDDNTDGSPSCPATTLAVGASMTCSAKHTFTQAELDANGSPTAGSGVLFNTVTATSAEAATVTATLSIPITYNPTMTVDKTSTTASLSAPDTVSYSYLVTNSGNVTLNNIALADDNADGLSCPYTTLAVGTNMTCTATHTFTQTELNANGSPTAGSGVLSNTVTATSAETSPVTTSLSIPIDFNPLLTVTKTSPTSTLNNHQSVSYRYVVINNGNVTLTGISLSDDNDNNDLTCPYTTLEPGAGMTCKATHTFTQAELDANGSPAAGSGVLSNTVTAFSNEAPAASDHLDIPIVYNPAMTVSKSSTTANLTASGSVTYRYMVINTGNVTLTAVTLSDDNVDAAPSCPSATLAAGSGMTCTATHTFTQAELDANGSPTAGSGVLYNAVTADSNETDPVDADLSIPITQDPKMTVEKYSTSTNLSAPETVTYTYQVSNTGNLTLTGIALLDTNITSAMDCPATTLAVGDSMTCTATHDFTQAELDANGSPTAGSGVLDNTVIADSTEAAAVMDHLSIPITRNPGLAVEKYSSTAKLTAPATVSYTYQVTNTGNVTLTGVNLSDDNLTSVIACPAGSLAVGDSMTCTATHDFTQAELDANGSPTAGSGVLKNTVTASATEVDSVTDSLSIPIALKPALTVDKTLTATGPFGLGSSLTYTVTVKNGGNTTLSNVTVADASANLGVCTPAQPASLAVGASMTCPASHTVNQTDVDAGSYTNTAGADSDQTGVASDSQTVAIERNPALTIAKTLTTSGPGPFALGETLTFDIVVTNSGDVNLTAVTVSDPGATLGTCTPPQPAGLAVDASMTCPASHVVNQTDVDAGTYTNTASADSDQTTPESVDKSVAIQQTPALAVEKSSPTTSIAAIGPVPYTLTVRNAGDMTLSGITISDPNCDAAPALVSGDANGDAKLDVSETWTYTCVHTVTQAEIDVGGSLTNTVSVDSNETANVTASLSIPIAQNPSIAVVKSSATTSITAAGQGVPYTFTVSNGGNVTLTGVTLSDPLCDVAPAAPSGDTNGDSKLDLSETWTYTCDHTVTQAEVDAGGNLSNTVTVDSVESAPASSTLDIPISQNAVIAVVKSSTTTAITAAGQVVPYTFTVSNAGNETLSGVTIADVKCDVAPSSPTGDANGDSKLDLGETWTYTCEHTVSQVEIDAGGNLTNTVTADSAESAPASSSYAIPVTQNPVIAVVKSSTTTSITAAGQGVPYTFTVSNGGNETLSGVTLSDPLCDVAPAAPSGDANGDSKLDLTETWTYTCNHTVSQVEIDAGGNLSNTVTVDSAESAPASSSYAIPVTQNPVIAVVKSSTTTSITAAGQVVPYTFTVSNSGNETLSGVTIADANCDVAPSSPSGDANGDSKLDLSEIWVYTCEHTVTQAEIDAGGNLSNTVTVDSAESAPASSSFAIPVAQNPAIAVVKSSATTSITAAGQVVPYTFTVSNAGNETLSGVTISDAKCDIAPSSPTGDANANSKLDLGETWTYTCNHTVTQTEIDGGGNLSNTVTADSAESGPASSTLAIPIAQAAAMTVVKSSTTTGLSAPGTVNYAYLVTNSGNQTLTGISLADDNIDSGSMDCPLTSLAGGASMTCTATHTFTQAELDANGSPTAGSGTLDNTVTASSNEATSVTDSLSIPISQNPQLAVTKTLTATGPFQSGSTLTFDIVVGNSGNVTLTNVTVSDASASISACTPATPAILAPGDSLTCQASHIANQTDVDAGAYTNTATASSDQPASASGSQTVTITQNPDLTISKTHSASEPGPFGLGDTLNYDIVVTNSGDTTLTNVTVSDPSATVGVCTPTQPASLAVNASLTCPASHVVTQADVDAGTYTNTASADSDQTAPKTDGESVAIAQSPAIAVLKSSTTTSIDSVAQVVPYTFAVSNAGNQTLTGISLSDPNCDVAPVLTSGDANADAKLDLGETWTYTCNHTVSQIEIDSGGNLTNTIAVDSNESAPASSSVSIPIVQKTGMTVDKSSATSSVTATGAVAYSYLVSNTGNVTLTGISLTDDNDDNNLSCPANTLAGGASMTCTATHTVTQAELDVNGSPTAGSGALSNTVTAVSNQVNGVTASLSIPIVQSMRMAVAKSSPTTSLSAPGSVNYTYLVSNTGNVTLTGISLADDNINNDMNCPADSLAGGASMTCTATHTFTQAELDANGSPTAGSGVLTNSVTTSSNEAAQVTTSLSIPIVQNAAIQVVKSSTTGAISAAGQVVTYAFAVTNTGNRTLSSITVSDPNCDVAPAYVSGDDNASSMLEIGENWSYTCDHTVTQAEMDAGGNLTNTVTADANESEPASASLDIPITVNPAIALVKTGSLDLGADGVATVGDVISYTFTVRNTGNVTLSNVAVSDPLIGVSGGPLASLAPGASDSATFSGSYTLTQADINNGAITNTASVSGTSPAGATVSAADDDTQAWEVKPVLGLAKQMTAEPVQVSPGVWDVTFAFLIENDSNVPLTNVQINDDLAAAFPAPTTFKVQSLASSDLAVNWPGYDGTGDVKLLNGSDTLAVGQSARLTLVVRVTPASAGPFENSATASGTLPAGGAVTDVSQDGAAVDPDGDGNPGNNGDPTAVTFGAHLFDPPFGVKQVAETGASLLRWTMVWINDSNVVAVNAEASDEIPEGSVFVDNGTSSGYALPVGLPAGSVNSGVTCLDNTAQTTTQYCYYEGPTTAYPRGRVVWRGTLGADFGAKDAQEAANEIQISFTVKVNETVSSISNTAFISSDSNGDGDVLDAGEQNVSTATASWKRPTSEIKTLPQTGFQPGIINALPVQPDDKLYSQEDMRLEIPGLNLDMPVVGVPQSGGSWDVTWLGESAGWLNGTAYPTWDGNSVLTGHVWDAYNNPGPFAQIKTLRYDDKIEIHAFGQIYTYAVRENRLVLPNQTGVVLKHEDKAWVTLVTCENYDTLFGSYSSRRMVRAVLVSVTQEK